MQVSYISVYLPEQDRERCLNNLKHILFQLQHSFPGLDYDQEPTTMKAELPYDGPIQFRLVDDGTLDTVLACVDCGEEFRFNPDKEYETNVERIAWAMEWALQEHTDCVNAGEVL